MTDEMHSPEDDEIYSKEDKLAFMRVGEFMNWFAQLEMQVDESILRVLGIEPIAGRLLLSYTPMRSKCEFLKKLANLTDLKLSPSDMKEATQTISRIQVLHDTRNVLTHCVFKPDGLGVKFFEAEKASTENTSPKIDESRFQSNLYEMVKLWGKLGRITSRIQTKMSEKQIAEAMTRLRNEGEFNPFTKML